MPSPFPGVDPFVIVQEWDDDFSLPRGEPFSLTRQRKFTLALMAGLTFASVALLLGVCTTLFGGHAYSPGEITIGSITAVGDGTYEVTFKIPRVSIMLKCSEVAVGLQRADGEIPVHFVAKTDYGQGVAPRNYRKG